MTTEHATGGTAVVNVAAARVLRSASATASGNDAGGVTGVEDGMLQEEVALAKEEDKLMACGVEEDEEITSEEEGGEVAASMERTMLTVALVKSVVETSGRRSSDSKQGEGPASPASSTSSADHSSKHRYGLRKRRRPTGQDLERLEHFQSTTAGGLARVLKKACHAVDETDTKDPGPHEEATPRKRPAKPTVPVSSMPPPPLLQKANPASSEADRGPTSSTPTATATASAAARLCIPRESILLATKKAPQSAATLIRSTSCLPTASPPAQSLPTATVQSTSLPAAPSVPNPLAKPVALASRGTQARKHSKTACAVPCPLAATTPKADIPVAPLTSGPVVPASEPAVPSSKRAAPASEPAVPAPEPPAATSSFCSPAGRTALASTTETDEGKRKVTIQHDESVAPAAGSASAGSRARGYSIEFESMGLDLDESSQGRSRAFSFECFAFGINADEPLPPLEQSVGPPPPESVVSNGGFHPGEPVTPVEPDVTSSATGVVKRPRGDSIIFDPVSFQEGGIHEQNALKKARDPTSLEGAAGVPVVEQLQPEQVQSSAAESAAAPSALAGTDHSNVTAFTAAATSADASPTTATVTTTSSGASTTTTTTTTVSATSTFSMELLNKDGRIGIYLPEARRARIARFHAKRAKRIWRKRIKYDCRKKLADSRPRIKGRFVKRSDME